MTLDHPIDDGRSRRKALRAERLGRLRATAVCTLVQSPAPPGIAAHEAVLIMGGLACGDEVVADMALPLAEPRDLPPPAPVRETGSPGRPVQAPPANPLTGFGGREELAGAISLSHALSTAVDEPIRATGSLPPASSEATLPPAAVPPSAQPADRIFRLDAAEAISPRMPRAMPAFTLTKAATAATSSGTSPYPVSDVYRQLRQNVWGQLSAEQTAVAWICPTGSEPLSDHLVELAVAMAEACEGEILLVDANFQSAALTRRFNLGEKAGLADVLSKKVPPQAAGHETAVARVRVLPRGDQSGGRAARRANEEEWKRLMSSLKERYRYILIDAPGVEEPHCLPLAKAADAAFLTIALDHTPRETVEEALEHLQLHKACVAGCVITDAPT